MAEQNMPFIKNLASSDRRTRESALASLQTFLTARHAAARLDETDALKLWKGLFVAVWMSDRPVPQQRLCAALADLLRALPAPAVAPWLRAFWATLGRDWLDIDRLRMNKFMLLVRRVLAAAMAWMRADFYDPAAGDHAGPGGMKGRARKGGKKGEGGKEREEEEEGEEKEEEKEEEEAEWDAARVDTMLALLAEWPLSTPANAGSKKIDVGLRLHVLDIWVDEAEKVGLLGDEEGHISEEALAIIKRLSALVEDLKRETLTPSVRIRATEALEDERLPWNRKEAGEDAKAAGDGDEDEEMRETDSWDGFGD